MPVATETYAESAAWAAARMPLVTTELGKLFFIEAPREDDLRRATDLVLVHGRLDISVRLRRHDALRYHIDEITLRDWRPNDQPTELAKVLAGHGHYLFYGFVHPDGQRLCRWILGDLEVFRRWYGDRSRDLPPGEPVGERRWNRDGSSSFQAFHLAELPTEFLVADQTQAGALIGAVPSWHVGPNAPGRLRLLLGQLELPEVSTG